MLTLLVDLLKKNALYFQEEIGKVPASACPSINFKGIDFDKFKDEFSKKIGLKQSLKSCDVLMILESKDELHLVEMKRHGKTISCEDFIAQQFLSEGIPNKIVDSIFLILAFIGYYQIDNKFYRYFLDPTKLKIKSYMVSDFTAEEMVTLNLASLDKRSVHLSKLTNSFVGILSCQQFESMHK